MFNLSASEVKKLASILLLVAKNDFTNVRLSYESGGGIGTKVIARINDVDHDITDYGLW